MDAHPESDCEQQMPENFSAKEDSGDNAIIKSPSNPEAEEEQRLAQHGGESEFESEGEEEETEDLSPGVTAMSHLHVSGQERQQDSETIIARIKRRQEQEQLKQQQQQHMEREYMAHTERMIRDEMGYLNSPESNHHHPAGNGSSKSATPSPTSPPPTQYLYAAGHPFSSALFNPSQMAAAAQAAAVAMANATAAHHHQIPPISAGSSSAGSATPPNNGIGSMSSPRGAAGEGDQSKYTFEEQFKQLYELSDDPRRKEFLDDLFSYMQKRGTPVNRIPIMAKQVLDLYELYRLVVARGGLVEVINKKIWREITKGLNLPSSITSAAFTLRTQYMKYLYPYECVKEKLSTNEELQAAIDGNRREGRRSSYGPYSDLVTAPRNSHQPPLSSHPSPLSMMPRHMNGHGSNPGLPSSGRGSSASPLPLTSYYPSHNSTHLPLNLAPSQENGMYSNHALSSESRLDLLSPEWDMHMAKRNGYSPSGEEDNCNSIPSTPNPIVMPQQEALNLEVSRNSSANDQKPLNMASRNSHSDSKPLKRQPMDDTEDLRTTSKRLLIEEERRSSMPSTHIKISNNRGPDGRPQSDGSLSVSMEVNGILYTGVLYASTQHRSRL
ncbi:protein dead ringer homolog isoform X3 [Argiope bruennichi]|uniref:protein dead ringer homolog isoform X3 n=1 Tax=Argiope bruennichi TaxID=94029 RepID=UPI00249556EF|nr:protein dead ringer homolog isoform X3 [Argiope bruennichi]